MDYAEIVSKLRANIQERRIELYRKEGALMLAQELLSAQQAEVTKPVTTVAADDWKETGIFYECD